MEYIRRYNEADDNENESETIQELADRIIDDYLNTTFVNNTNRLSTIESVFTPRPTSIPRENRNPRPIDPNVEVYYSYMFAIRDHMSQYNQMSRTYLQMMQTSYTSLQNRNRNHHNNVFEPPPQPRPQSRPQPPPQPQPRTRGRPVVEAPRRYTNTTMRNIYTTTIPLTPHRYENVTIRPTQEQIQRAVRRVVYDDAVENLSRSCPITLEQFENGEEISQIIHCGHCFSQDALTNLFRTSVRCPVCRFDVRDTLTTTNQNINSNPPSRLSSRTRRNRDDIHNTNTETPTDPQLQESIESMVSMVTSLISERRNLDISGNFIYTFEIPLSYYDTSLNLLH